MHDSIFCPRVNNIPSVASATVHATWDIDPRSRSYPNETVKSRIGSKTPKEEKVRKQVKDMTIGLEQWHSSDLVWALLGHNVEARLTTDIPTKHQDSQDRYPAEEDLKRIIRAFVEVL